MYTIKMNEDKTLEVTVRGEIHQGRSGAGSMTFIMPATYEEYPLADHVLLLKYTLPDETTRAEQLRLMPRFRGNQLRYFISPDSKLASQVGTVTVWLTLISVDDNVVFSTSKSTVEIAEAKQVVATPRATRSTWMERRRKTTTPTEEDKGGASV